MKYKWDYNTALVAIFTDMDTLETQNQKNLHIYKNLYSCCILRNNFNNWISEYEPEVLLEVGPKVESDIDEEVEKYVKMLRIGQGLLDLPP